MNWLCNQNGTRRCSQTTNNIKVCLFVAATFVFSHQLQQSLKKKNVTMRLEAIVHQSVPPYTVTIWSAVVNSAGVTSKSKGDISIATVARGPVAAQRNVRAVRRLLKYLRISVDYFHRRKPCNTLCWAHISTPVGPIRNPWMASVWSFAPTSFSTESASFGFRKIFCFSFQWINEALKKKHVDFDASLDVWLQVG